MMIRILLASQWFVPQTGHDSLEGISVRNPTIKIAISWPHKPQTMWKVDLKPLRSLKHGTITVSTWKAFITNGRRLHAGRTRWPPGCQYTFWHVMLIFLPVIESFSFIQKLRNSPLQINQVRACERDRHCENLGHTNKSSAGPTAICRSLYLSTTWTLIFCVESQQWLEDLIS